MLRVRRRYDPALSGQILGALRPMSALYGAPDGLHGGGSPTAGMPANAMAGYAGNLPPQRHTTKDTELL